jgi:O-antigen/teichoic acid export membrane protein
MQTAQDQRTVVASRPAVPRAGDQPGAQVRGSTWLLIGQMLGIAINLSSQVLVVRYLTKESFGAFAFALSIVAVGEVVATFGLRRAVSRFVPIHMEHGRLGAAAGLLLFATAGVAGLGLVVALLLVAFSGPIGDSVGGTHAATVLAVLGFIIPVSALENLFDAIFAMFHHAKLIALRSYVYIPLARMGVVIALIASGSGVVVLAAGWVIAGAVGVAIYGVMLRGALRANGLLQPMLRRAMEFPVGEFVRFSVPIFTQDFASVLTFAAPTLVLGAVAGATDVGAVRTVIPVALTMLHIRSNFALLFVPSASRLFAQRDTAAMSRLYWRSALWMAAFVLPVVLLAVPFGDPLTTFLFGERYASSAPVLGALVTGIFISLALGPNLDLLAVYARVRFIAWSNVASIVLVLAMSAGLVGFGMGPLGAGIASGACLAVLGLWWQGGVARFTGVPPIGSGVVRLLVLAVAACVALGAVQVLVHPPFAACVALVIVAWSGIILALRGSLEIDDTFPVLGRLPGLSRLASRPEPTVEVS